jgi:flavin-dependent dehydrogenase
MTRADAAVVGAGPEGAVTAMLFASADRAWCCSDGQGLDEGVHSARPRGDAHDATRSRREPSALQITGCYLTRG